jgi:hypothetical protein
MDLKDLRSSTALIHALGDFSTEIMELMHGPNELSEQDTQELRETLAEIHHLMARIGYAVS